jgi:Protein of unknown function (DUF3995)
VVTIIARLVAAALGALALMHVYWAVGGRAGKSIAVPEINGRPAFVPSTAGTLAVAAALFFAASVVAIAGGLVGVGGYRGLFRILALGLSATFLARAVGDFRLVGFFKRVRGTRFALLDTTVFAPLCLVFGLAVLYVAYHDD